MKRILLSALLALGMGYAATLPYQGLATDANGNPKPDAAYAVKFSLYSSASGGAAVWIETQSVATKKGLFSTILGSSSEIPDALFNGPSLYLGVSFDGGVEGGRALLGTTPWAKRAGVADSARNVAGLLDSVSSLRLTLKSVASAIVDSVRASGTSAYARRSGIADSSRASHFADSAKVAIGLSDSVSALRSALAGQSGTISALSATVTLQGAQIAAKDSVGKAHIADSAEVSWKSDTAKIALHVIGADSILIEANSIAAKTARDSVALLTVRVKDDSAGLKIARDSVKLLTDAVNDQATIIAGLNTTLSSQSATLSSQATSLSFFQSILSPSSNGIAWNTVVPYGYVVDSRDGQVYRTVIIGTQTWMAQNLNYRNTTGSSDTVGMCYINSADSCAKYGRLYTWAQVMNGSTSSSSSPSGVKGICPTGWHVPSDAEWTTMQTYVDASNAAVGTKLKSTSGWSTNTGTDTYGFRALPGGYVDGTSFENVGIVVRWWSATQYVSSNAWFRSMSANYANVSGYYGIKSYGFSLRCVKD